jgi:hypothetical protein
MELVADVPRIFDFSPALVHARFKQMFIVPDARPTRAIKLEAPA